MKEHVLSLNAFNMPKVFDETNTNYILIIRLLLLDPGKFQSHPKMGVGLRTRYRFNNDEDVLYSLKADIENQISTYLPTLMATNFSLTINNNILGIIIDTSNGSYVLGYNTETKKIDAAASYVLNDL